MSDFLESIADLMGSEIFLIVAIAFVLLGIATACFLLRKRRWIFPFWFPCVATSALWTIFVLANVFQRTGSGAEGGFTAMGYAFLLFGSLPIMIFLVGMLFALPRGVALERRTVVITIILYVAIVLVVNQLCRRTREFVVIDNHGQPVSGVRFQYHHYTGGGVWRGLRGEGERISDRNGRIGIRVYASETIQFEGIKAEGYESAAQYGYNYFPEALAQEGHAERDPVVFELWKLQGAEPLYYRRTRGSIPCDGTHIRFDLKMGREVKTGGDLQVSLIRTPLHINRGREKYDWVANIDMLGGGGFIQSNDDYMNEAPETGYSPSMTIEMRKQDPDWKSQVSVPLYFKTADGRFGRVKLEFATDFEPPPTGFNLEIYLNPSGSRNLEYDVNKKINTQ